MSDSPASAAARSSPLPAVIWFLVGALLVAGAWLVPVNFKSITPALLEAAGERTPAVSALGEQLLETDKLGPAALVLTTAQAVGDPGAARLETRWEQAVARQPELVPWGGWDPFLEPLFNLEANRGRTESTPVLTFFIAREARETLARYLGNSRSSGVRALLATRQIDRTARFVPATRAGGQPLDAVVLLAALLFQGEHFSGPLQRQLRELADLANASGEMGALEAFYTDLLSLGRRLDWTQLDELVRRAESTATLAQFAHLGRVAGDDLAVIYTATLLSNSADEVAAYLLRFGEAGLADLRLALRHGRGAVQRLLQHQVPVNRDAGPTVGGMAQIALVQPQLLLVLRWLGFFIGAFALIRFEKTLFTPAGRPCGLH